MNTTTSTNYIPLYGRSALLLLLRLIGCFAFSLTMSAVSPAPDGGYTGGNTAEGDDALFNLSKNGYYNTAIGFHALYSNTDGCCNTAVGNDALAHDTLGRLNTATGYQAMLSNTTGEANTATGRSALAGNTTGDDNTADGAFALSGNTTGESNTAIGFNALARNTSGVANTAVGRYALNDNTIGSGNVALGFQAGMNATTGDSNVYMGTGMEGVAGEAHHTYIRNINVTSVSGGGTDTVTVNLATGLLGHLTSSRRYKEDITPMDKASEAVFALKPVIYHYKKEIDPGQSPAFGLIAEEVAEVNPNLVAHNSHREPESIH
jgi:hypothetical protein